MEEVPPPTKKLCNCGADLSSLSVYHIRKHLAGSKHLKVQAVSGLRTLDASFSPMHVHQGDACGAAPVHRAGNGGSQRGG